MREKEDLRVRRTRKLLLEALFSLMQTKSFDKISVSDICDKAMVHRATFYNHFKDKNDLLNYGLDELQEHMFNEVSKDKNTSSKQMCLHLASNMVDFITDNHDKIELVIANGTEKFFKITYEATQRAVCYLLSKNRDKRKSSLPIDFVANFIAGGLCSVGVQVFSSPKKYTKAEMMRNIEKILGEVVENQEN